MTMIPGSSTMALNPADPAPASPAVRLVTAESFTAAPAATLQAVAEHPGPILLDLDETLYLRNSTEDFIDTALPGLLALLLLRALDAFKPWRYTGGNATRDVWRVNLIRWLMPWTMRLWRRRCARLAQAHTNRPLLDAIGDRRDRTWVVTVGFAPIVTPLVAAIGLRADQVVACAATPASRREGKLTMARRALGDARIDEALLVTDSAEDLPLLQRCARGQLTIWPEARFQRALRRVYLPGQYLSQVKRPNERYIIRGILQEDFAFWVLSSVTLAAFPFWHTLGLLLLATSFWAIYERGYVDNDLVASTREAEPRLSAAFFDAPVATPRLLPWIWAAGLGYVGIGLLRHREWTHWLDLAHWMAMLAATYGVFYVYNRLDKPSRVWLFPALQFARTAAFAALVPVTTIGGVALSAHVLARWMPYYWYRQGSKKWPETMIFPLRLAFFVAIALTLAMAEGWSLLWTPATLLLLGWNVFRARHELRAAVRRVRSVS